MSFDAYQKQPLPIGDGKDVATLVKTDLNNKDFQEATRSFRCVNLFELYFTLVAAAVDLRSKLTGSSTDEQGFVAVADDIEQRVQGGEKKYGTRLKTNNGRNALLDGYQEILDAIDYIRQEISQNENVDD